MRDKTGFTIIELLIVITIIGILFSITLVSSRHLGIRNKSLACQMNLKNIEQALKMYRLDEGAYPPFDPITNPADPGLGLNALYIARYITSPRVLHCPHDTSPITDPTNPYNSYQCQDPETAQWTYLPDRTDDINDPDYNRQLKISPYPRDNTVVTWCPFHYGKLKRGGKSLYPVLFLDGTVELHPEPDPANPDPYEFRGWRTIPKGE